MMNMTKTVFLLSLIALLAASLDANATTRAAYPATSKISTATISLDNLERERAAFVGDLLNVTLSHEERLKRLNTRQRILTDMERMVMRDERLSQSNSSHVQKAFSSYETTFLVHAGAESNQSAAEQWLANINLSNQAVMQAQMSFRR